jgi:site-specific DNA-methyltransferase (adenine-specific)
MIEPYYQDNLVTIYHGDCAEIVPQLGRFDLLLTDPPYGVAHIMKGGSGNGWAKFQDEYADRGEWDHEAPQNEVALAIKACQNAIVWGGNYFTLTPSRCWLVWNKPERNFTMGEAELAYTTMDKPIRVWDGGRQFPSRVHPTQKPEGLMEWCIKQVGEEVNSIMDPFMGSGTTLVAARRNGIRCVGIDREEKYCEIARQRVQQRSLFEI